MDYSYKHVKRVYNQTTQADHAADTYGRFRAGNSGIVGTDGRMYGECLRKTIARYLGLGPTDATVTDIDQGFWDAGLANELIVTQVTRQVMDPSVQVWTDRDGTAKTSWYLPGTQVEVTGRPDLVVAVGNKPVYGYELKAKVASNAAVNLWMEQEPSSDHVAQALHYTWQLGLPTYSLVYSYRGETEAQAWRMVKASEAGYRRPEMFTRSGVIRQKAVITSFDTEFLIQRPADNSKTITIVKENKQVLDTAFSVDGLIGYYTTAYEHIQNQTMPERPRNWRIFSSNNPQRPQELPYSKCGKCKFADHCDRYENSYSDWTNSLKKLPVRTTTNTGE